MGILQRRFLANLYCHGTIFKSQKTIQILFDFAFSTIFTTFFEMKQNWPSYLKNASFQYNNLYGNSIFLKKNGLFLSLLRSNSVTVSECFSVILQIYIKIVKMCFKKSKFNCKSKFSDIVTRTRIQKAVKTRESTFRQQKQRTFGQFL